MVSNVNRPIGAWLITCCALLFVLIVVGGATRLTRSGLSIVEWQPIIGALPPLNETQWLALFDKYKQTPEYKQVNFGMSLDAFKGIFWWEYAHRLLGRLLGLAFLMPALWFIARGRVGRILGAKLAAIFVLGALQGALGWYMVSSGLVDDPRVSHIRLTAHLGIAFLIFAGMLWVALDLLRGEKPARHVSGRDRRRGLFAIGFVWLVFVTVLSGGLVAGIRAGLAYNTFPLMNGHLVPPEIFMIDPWYLNFVNNMATVQFDHRVLAAVLVLGMLAMRLASRYATRALRVAMNVLLTVVTLQVLLGISTLLLRVPIILAAAHQAGAVLVFASALWVAHVARR